MNQFAVKELPDKLANLRFQKLKEAKHKKPQPFVSSINTGSLINQQPSTVKQEIRYVEQPQQVIRQEEQRFIVQPNYYQSVSQNRTYVNPINYNPPTNSNQVVINNQNIGGSTFNAPPHVLHQTGYT